MQKYLAIGLALIGLVAAALLLSRFPKSGTTFKAIDGRLMLFEFHDEDILHFEISNSTTGKIGTSPMVAASANRPKVSVKRLSDGLETNKIRVKVDTEKACFQVTDKLGNYNVAEFCPINQGLTIAAPEMQNAYGLGQQFLTPGKIDGDWVGKVRDPGTDDNPHNRGKPFGNNMTGYNGGAVGNTQIPILFALGAEKKNFAFFFDNVFRQRWDLTAQPWKVEASGGDLRGFVFTGPNLPHLRSAYLKLTGLPPVPPKKAFGLWISEFGFNNWKELDSKLASLRMSGFPLDGFVLDLYWFGGIKQQAEDSPMGGLNWDLKNFPDPAGKIAALRRAGLGLVVIEEPYISKGLPEHTLLAERGYLAKDSLAPNAPPTYLDYNSWWGKGGLLDFVNEEAGRFWHDEKRKPLVDMGVLGHWTDLGEPEMFSPESFYAGKYKHAEIHNLYNLKWSESVFEGYQRHNVERRPWILSRSGTAGSQRYGVAMWSADIGSNLSSLTSHINVQMHMSLSGIDYFGSDIGGFHRRAVQGDLNEMYTQWFAVGALLDVPVRVHTENVSNSKETAPDRIGHRPSNLFNIRQRYELNPYYYSLAHLAHRDGSPLVAPLVYHYQEDLQTRSLGDHKMIGPDLLTATISAHGQRSRDIYLPKGTWFDYYTHLPIVSDGDWIKDVAAYNKERIFRLPIYAREGAIIPLASSIRVYPSDAGSEFTIFEDDGETIAYQAGQLARTRVSQIRKDGAVTLTIAASEGEFKPTAKTQMLSVVQSTLPTSVLVDGVEVEKIEGAAWGRVNAGWRMLEGMVQIKIPRDPTKSVKAQIQ